MVSSVAERDTPPASFSGSGKHTPGPWFVGEDDHNGQAVVRAEHIEVATCWHHCVEGIEREMRCNARLIAAAPDMLAVLCEMFVDEGPIDTLFQGNPGAIDALVARARAAIAKATFPDASNQPGSWLGNSGKPNQFNPQGS